MQKSARRKVHEPDAVELQPDIVRQDRFESGEARGRAGPDPVSRRDPHRPASWSRFRQGFWVGLSPYMAMS